MAEAALGGPEKHRERHTSRGKLLPRERVERLLDPGWIAHQVEPVRDVGDDPPPMLRRPLLEPGSHLFEQGRGRYGPHLERRAALVEAGHHEKVLGELAQPVHLLSGGGHDRLELLARARPARGPPAT